MSDVWQFLVRFFVFALMHSICALPSLKNRCVGNSRHLLKFYRLYYNGISLVLFGWVLAAYRNSTVLYVVPGVWSLVLYFMQMFFLIILAFCVKQTGAAGFLGIAGNSSSDSKTAALVTHGWYRVVRHPLYLFSSLFLLCNPIISIRSLLVSLISMVYFCAGAILEERRLLREFGDEYREYQRTVPFILPRFTSSNDCI